MTSDNWKQDPRLKGMDPEKLDFLTKLAEEAGQSTPEGLLPLLLRVTQNRQHTDFTDQETDLLLSILTANLTPAQKKQVETLRTLSRRFAGASKKT